MPDRPQFNLFIHGYVETPDSERPGNPDLNTQVVLNAAERLIRSGAVGRVFLYTNCLENGVSVAERMEKYLRERLGEGYAGLPIFVQPTADISIEEVRTMAQEIHKSGDVLNLELGLKAHGRRIASIRQRNMANPDALYYMGAEDLLAEEEITQAQRESIQKFSRREWKYRFADFLGADWVFHLGNWIEQKRGKKFLAGKLL